MKEFLICASRGRNKDDPNDRRAGIELEQRLEINTLGICNTLTSVCKDCYVLEIYASKSDKNGENRRRKTFEKAI